MSAWGQLMQVTAREQESQREVKLQARLEIDLSVNFL